MRGPPFQCRALLHPALDKVEASAHRSTAEGDWRQAPRGRQDLVLRLSAWASTGEVDERTPLADSHRLLVRGDGHRRRWIPVGRKNAVRVSTLDRVRCHASTSSEWKQPVLLMCLYCLTLRRRAISASVERNESCSLRVASEKGAGRYFAPYSRPAAGFQFSTNEYLARSASSSASWYLARSIELPGRYRRLQARFRLFAVCPIPSIQFDGSDYLLAPFLDQEIKSPTSDIVPLSRRKLAAPLSPQWE